MNELICVEDGPISPLRESHRRQTAVRPTFYKQLQTIWSIYTDSVFESRLTSAYHEASDYHVLFHPLYRLCRRCRSSSGSLCEFLRCIQVKAPPSSIFQTLSVFCAAWNTECAASVLDTRYLSHISLKTTSQANTTGQGFSECTTGYDGNGEHESTFRRRR